VKGRKKNTKAQKTLKQLTLGQWQAEGNTLAHIPPERPIAGMH
jgi:hypothetical protein